MPKKKKISLSSNKKYHYRKNKTDTKPLQTGLLYGNDSAHEEQVSTSKTASSASHISHDHCYSKPVQEYDSDKMETVDLSNGSQNEEIPEQIEIFDVDHVEEILTAFQQLKKNVERLYWGSFEVRVSQDTIRFYELYESNFTSVKLSVELLDDFVPRVHVHNKLLPNDHDIWKSMPHTLQSVEQIEGFLQNLSKYEVCPGNFDPEFQDITPVCSGITHPQSLEIAALRESDIGASHGTIRYTSTIRSVNCQLLCLKSSNQCPPRCKACGMFRGNLRRIISRREQLKNRKSTQILVSRKPLSCMSKTELKEKCQGYKLQCNRLKLRVEKLKSQLRTEINTVGEELQEKDNSDFVDMINECDNEIIKAYPDENSFQRLFWEEQKKYNKLCDKRQMKWHPMIIKWCLFLRHKSATTYTALKDMGFINLPSTRTLYDYSHYVKSGCGFLPDVTKQLMKEVQDKKLTENWQTFVGLLFDEIRIKSDLVYNKHTGELIGFMNLDEVGNAIVDLERQMTNAKGHTLARYVLVIYVRGVATNLKFPLAHFATGGITADILYPLIWEALEILEVTVGLKVLFITCDGASPNRKYFKLHHPPVNVNDATVYCTENPYALDENRYLHFISDVPHLLKTSRNCFANSNSHRKTRKLWFNTDISWMHIVDLYEECMQGIYNFCPKLTRAHIDLTPFGCMKVKLAAQVLSDTVALALCHTRGDGVGGTVKFIRNMNKFFDCLNSRHLYEGQNKRNSNLKPYTCQNDERLRWLSEDFLTYFEEWRFAVETRQGNFTKQQRSAMMISYQTLEGIKISVKSIVSCIKYMLSLGTPFILTEVFNQDILEQHFGHHRGRCGSNTNPTLAELDNNMIHLRVIGSQAISSISGNTIKRQNDRIVDGTPLPKRKLPRV